MDKLIALNILPQEQLDLAYTHETNELNRYKWLALSFLPIDPPVSQLMSAIGTECLHRLCSLEDVARRMDLNACVNKRLRGEPPPFFNNNKQHFFVVNEQMGRQVLQRAVKAAKETFTLFGWLLETNATPELHRPFFSFTTQKNNEYQLLKECREQWRTGLLKSSKQPKNEI